MEASVVAFCITLFAVLSVLYRKHSKYDEWIAAGLLYGGSMQVIEALLWIDMPEKRYNAAISQYIPLYLIGQVVVSALWAYRFEPRLGLIVLSAAVCLFVYFAGTQANYSYDTTIGPNGRLVWNTYDKDGQNVRALRNFYLNAIFFVLWFVPSFIILGKRVMWFWPFWYLLAAYVYSFSMFWKTGEASSNWCFIGAGLGVLLVLFPLKDKT